MQTDILPNKEKVQLQQFIHFNYNNDKQQAHRENDRITFNKISKPTIIPDIPKVRVNASKPVVLFP